MSSGNHAVEQTDRRLGDPRLIEELDHERQIDIETKNVVRPGFAASAEPGDASEYDDPLNGVLVLQEGEDLLHQRLAPTLVCFAQVDASNKDFIVHAYSSLQISSERLIP